jgi:hypothetical protein
MLDGVITCYVFNDQQIRTPFTGKNIGRKGMANGFTCRGFYYIGSYLAGSGIIIGTAVIPCNQRR